MIDKMTEIGFYQVNTMLFFWCGTVEILKIGIDGKIDPGSLKTG